MNLKKFVLILCAIIAIGGGFILGWVFKPDAPDVSKYAQATPQISSVVETDNEVQSVDKVGENRILPTTKVRWHVHFSSCPESYEYEGTAGINGGSDITGMSKAEIEEAYKNCTVEQLTGTEAYIDIMLEGYCPQHYPLKVDNDSNILVNKRDEITYEQRIVVVRPLSMDDFSLEVQEEFKEGLPFDSLEAVDSYIEGLDS